MRLLKCRQHFNSIQFIFPNNTFLSSLSLFVTIDLYLLIPGVFAEIFNTPEEIIMSTGTQTSEANAEIKMQPVIVETKLKLLKISKCVEHNLNT